jgi:2-polyprenyl-3-methyl-5-hydroxy-6-metoxy-1,4-benzoquinol methylase
MDRAAPSLELLDGPLDDQDALVANLRDLGRLNWLTGGTVLSRRAIAALGDTTRLLDVGTGGADIPLSLLAAARRRGRALTVTALDNRPEVLAAARIARPTLAATPGLSLALGDGLGLPYPDASFDVAHASLVLHHLEEGEAIAFLREMRRVASRGIVVNDLARSRLAWIGALLLTRTVARGRYTRNDGPLSVRRGWTRAEMLDLLDRAGLAPVATFGGVAGHRYAIAAR